MEMLPRGPSPATLSDSQPDQEGVVDLCQNLLFIVDMLLLLQSDHVGDLHLL